ncbi:MAG: YitT family protein [Chloroflexota bacterium]|nr:YitT family protein [Chloroflexota bacterium]
MIQALALRLILVPADLVSGGISGLAQLVHHYTALPIGMIVLVGNISLFIMGWGYLGGPRFALRTMLSILSFSVFTDILTFFLPSVGVTDDMVLNTLYGGLLLGVGLGIVYRGVAPAVGRIYWAVSSTGIPV